MRISAKGRVPDPQPARRLHHSRPTLHPAPETRGLAIMATVVGILASLAVILAALILPTL